jgi:hypothetical protein
MEDQAWHNLLDERMAEVTAQHRRLSSTAGESKTETMDVEKVHAAYEENKMV